MIKFYCDRCNRECQELERINIPNIKNSPHFSTKTIQVCSACKEEAENLYDKLTDIKFVLFRDFMKGGVE